MPPAPQSGGGGQSQDDHMGAMWLAIGLCVLIFVLWSFLHTQILAAFIQLKLWEVNFVLLFSQRPAFLKTALLSMNPSNVNLSYVASIANQVGSYFRIPTVACLVFFAFALYRRSMASRFRRVYSMKDLLKAGNENWPQTTPVVQLDLVKISVEEGPWAMAMTPMQFAKRHQLLKEKEEPLDDNTLSTDAKTTVSVIRPKAGDIFIQQVGALWESPASLPPHIRALFAIFAARVAQDPDASYKVLMDIATSATGGRLDFSGVPALLSKYAEHADVVAIIKKHAYVYSVMASLLEKARRTGVLASADFLWLKLVDRRLWFMLNGVGRQTPTVEVAGPFAHWLVEKKLKRPVITPMIEDAINALENAVKDVVYKPEGDR